LETLFDEMKCHYETLGVPLDADQAQIKSAYRRLALKWHPDKNRENPDSATEQFKLVQSAYDVLSDVQDKAWYDKHRNEILHKQQFEKFDENEENLFEYFNTSCFKGFDNNPKGFFAIYGDLFCRISQLDEQFCDENEDFIPMPIFGDSFSDYDEVVHVFYSRWQSYSTKFSYVWVEKYDVTQAPSRRHARMISKENKKERDRKRRQRNELIHELVRFVRKRDPRVKKRVEEMKILNEAQKQKNESKRLEVLRKRLEEAAFYEEQNKQLLQDESEKLDKLEASLKVEYGSDGSDESVDEVEDDEEKDFEELFCVACGKNFKTSMQLKNHQKSKKHREKMNALKIEMMKVKKDEETISSKSRDCLVTNDLKDENEEILEKKKKKKKLKKLKKNKNFVSFQSEDFFGEKQSQDEDQDEDQKKDQDQDEDQKKNEDQDEDQKKDQDEDQIRDQDEDQKKDQDEDQKKDQDEDQIRGQDEDQIRDQDDDQRKDQDEDQIRDQDEDQIKDQDEDQTCSKASSSDPLTKNISDKKPKKKKRRNLSNRKDECKCLTCQNIFQTRNQLFKHLKNSGHAFLR